MVEFQNGKKRVKFHVGDHKLQLRSVHGVMSLYACASSIILATGFMHGFLVS